MGCWWLSSRVKKWIAKKMFRCSIMPKCQWCPKPVRDFLRQVKYISFLGLSNVIALFLYYDVLYIIYINEHLQITCVSCRHFIFFIITSNLSFINHFLLFSFELKYIICLFMWYSCLVFSNISLHHIDNFF